MKITPLTIDFDVTNEQEVAFVNELMNRLFGSAPLKAMAAPTESPVTSTSVPTFSEPTQTAAPVQEVKEEPKQETITEAIAEETIADAIAEDVLYSFPIKYVSLISHNSMSEMLLTGVLKLNTVSSPL